VTPRNEHFIELYIQYVVLGQAPPGKKASAAQAYRDAGYKVKDAKSAEVNASKLLSKSIIAEEVGRRKKEIADRHKVTTEAILGELKNIAFVNPLDYFIWDENGAIKFKSSKNLTREQAAAICSIKKSKNGGIEIKFHNKVDSLELLGRNQKLFTDKIMVDGQMVVFKGEDKLQD
jgi:hypothetical protein